MQPSNMHRIAARTAATAISLSFLLAAYGALSVQSASASTLDTTSNTPVATLDTTAESKGSSCTDQQQGVIANPLKFCSLNELLYAVLKAAIEIGTIILTIALVLVGFKFVAARGNEEKIRSAKTTLVWTIIGGLILLGATAIQEVITSTVGSLTS